ncbi:hypothetical protein GGS20DRAFT_583345 [Poronia punctata]|nr:hypothetical protein GGS20DRAFT_583345 [Poronia punctata]
MELDQQSHLSRFWAEVHSPQGYRVNRERFRGDNPLSDFILSSLGYCDTTTFETFAEYRRERVDRFYNSTKTFPDVTRRVRLMANLYRDLFPERVIKARLVASANGDKKLFFQGASGWVTMVEGGASHRLTGPGLGSPGRRGRVIDYSQDDKSYEVVRCLVLFSEELDGTFIADHKDPEPSHDNLTDNRFMVIPLPGYTSG